jgi:ABC-type multidrug transport system fused ATPase/permease subunit
MYAVVKKCLALLPSATRWRWASLLPLVVATAASEAVGAASVFALVKIVTDPAQAMQMPIVSSLFGWLGWSEPRRVTLTFTLLVALFYLAKNSLLTATEYFRGRCVGEATAELASTMLGAYLHAPYAFHVRRNSADLIRNTDHAVHRVFANVMSPVLGIATESLVVAGIVVVLVITAPLITLAAGSVLVLVSVVLLKATRREAIQQGTRVHALTRVALQGLQQALGAIKELKVLGRESFFEEDFRRTQRALARLRSRNALLGVLPRIVVETVFVGGALFVIVLVTLVGSSGADTVSLLGLYAYAGFRVIPSMNRVLWQLNEIRIGTALIDQLYEDYVQLAALRRPQLVGSDAKWFEFRDRIVFEHVSFYYDDPERPVLTDLHFVIERGQSVGIVGSTGAGKSTLIDLVVGVLEPSQGRILVDGEDLLTITRAWQRRIGYVPQTVFLIDDTIRRNVALGLPDREIEEQKLQTALQMAQLDRFVEALPEGRDTIVGERGVRLSGGERQRVGIARALYQQPEVLVFDEATSALDNRTEADLSRAIDALRGGKTLILIAHRLSTVRRCDRLVFLDRGAVAGIGSFAELMAGNARFREMATVPDEEMPPVENSTHAG